MAAGWQSPLLAATSIVAGQGNCAGSWCYLTDNQIHAAILCDEWRMTAN
jgi:hypothetical protein